MVQDMSTTLSVFACAGAAEPRPAAASAAVTRIMQGEGIPPFAVHAQQLLARSMDPDSGSSHLARVILKDLGLTSQILRVANSTLYNRSGRPIASVAHGITMLGWDTVRNLVGAMRFVEHYARRSPGLRELMALSLMSATHGREVAAAIGYRRPEEAYICGLFRNLGEVAVARYYGREYAEVLDLVARGHANHAAAAVRVFGFSFDDISQRLGQTWNLPPPVTLCLHDGFTASGFEERCLASAVRCAHELTTALYRNGTQYDARANLIIDPAGTPRYLSPREVRHIVEAALEETKRTFGALQIPVSMLQLEKQAEQARAILETGVPLSRVSYSLAELDGAIHGGPMDPQCAINLLANSAGFERAVFATISQDGNTVRGQLAAGETGAEALQRFRFSLLRGDPALHAAASRKYDLWINRQTDPRYESSRLVAAFNPSHFVLLPVFHGGRVRALLYADRHSLQVPDEVRPRVEQVRNLCAAMASRQSP